MDLISVILSVYNDADKVSHAVRSVLNQTHRNLELLIIDDGSTDRTWEVISSFAALDKRVVLLRNRENRGLAHSLNKGLEIAKGDFIARQDADDISHPDRLKVQLQVLTQLPVDLVFTRSCDVRAKWPNVLREQTILIHRGPLGINHFVHGSLLCSANLKGILKYDSKVKYGQDYSLWNKMILSQKILSIVDCELYKYSKDSIGRKKFIYQSKNAFDIHGMNWLSNLIFSPYLSLFTETSIIIYLFFGNSRLKILRRLAIIFWPFYLILPRNKWSKSKVYLTL